MSRPFVPIDFYDEDAEYVHANPNIVANVKISRTIGSSLAKEFPWTVETYLINSEIVEYYYKTKEEAKAFIRKLGDIK